MTSEQKEEDVDIKIAIISDDDFSDTEDIMYRWREGQCYFIYFHKKYIYKFILNIFFVTIHGSFAQEIHRLHHRKKEDIFFNIGDKIPEDSVNHAYDIDFKVANIAIFDIILQKLKTIYVAEDISLKPDIIMKYDRMRGIKTILLKSSPSPKYAKANIFLDFFIEDEFMKLNDIIPKTLFFIDSIQYNKQETFIYKVPCDYLLEKLTYKHKIQLFIEKNAKEDPYLKLCIPYKASMFNKRYSDEFDQIYIRKHVGKIIKYFLKKKIRNSKCKLQNITIFPKDYLNVFNEDIKLCCGCYISDINRVIFESDKDDNIIYTCPICEKISPLYLLSFETLIPK